MRDIAARAAIDPAMVIRYFGSKEALFARAADFDLRMPDLDCGPGSSRARRWCGTSSTIWEGQASDRGLTILLRSAASNAVGGGASCGTSSPVRCCRRLGVRVGRRAAERAGLVASQLLGLALCRYV